MGFIEAIRTGFTKYADFGGRARRSEYWWWSLFTGLVSLVMGIVLAILMTIAFVPVVSQADSDGNLPSDALDAGFWVPMVIGWGIYTVVLLGLLLPSLAVFVRRMHDTDRSGWWYWISLVPGGGIVLLVFAVQDSTPGANRYGPNPKGIDGSWPQAPHGYAAPGAPTGYQAAAPGYLPAPQAAFPAPPAPPVDADQSPDDPFAQPPR
ncbi:DUF805 domain-containing protein [Demequina capsici]|uniref:DUF805 domain-containing protein n=1 Tax=Demequina capsici TaxID=3075620 RepID=A0AA96JAT1_9MICO|nr:DUF805 domain-containing protein [Demequina sp. PMTSA13]WNM27298.1 DUF805 domain-containing protein [Demequina sp. PMTSA13]